MLYKFNKAAAEKKEMILIVIAILVFIFGVYFKHSRISSLSEESVKIQKEYSELQQVVSRDTLIQNKVMPIKELFNTNRRNNETFENMNISLLKKVESVLKELNIKYDSNDLKQERNETKEKGMSFFYMKLSFKAEPEKVMKLLTQLESDKSDIFDIMKLKISKDISMDNNRFDGFNKEQGFDANGKHKESHLLSVELKLRIAKFL